jgi:hypothetical protein
LGVWAGSKERYGGVKGMRAKRLTHSHMNIHTHASTYRSSPIVDPYIAHIVRK